MKYLYDSNTNAFYPFVLQTEYEVVGMWPENGVEVDEATFNEFQKPPTGKMRIAGEDGYPEWVDVPPPTHDELVAMADSQKQLLIDQANEHISSKQWPGKAAMGRLKDAEKVQYNAWLDYLDNIEAVDTSTAPDITWPTPPEV